MDRLTRRLEDFARTGEMGNHGAEAGVDLAAALGWSGEYARIEPVTAKGVGTSVHRGLVGDQAAAIFVSHNGPVDKDVLARSALFAYHGAIEWGIVTNRQQTTIFNSHWMKDGFWYHLPQFTASELVDRVEVLRAASPDRLAEGQLERIANGFYSPDSMVRPVDNSLVTQLDLWRDETLRHSTNETGVDLVLQRLFAQLFVLRVIEDRELLGSSIRSLRSALETSGDADKRRLRGIFRSAQALIQGELFRDHSYKEIPAFVLGGIIADLYTPRDLPPGSVYDFSWIDADVLGQAYQKYLSTLLIPVARVAPQLSMFNQAKRDVVRETVRKATGVYYTPAFLQRFITEQSLSLYERSTGGIDRNNLPVIADVSCGSGSFLVTAVDILIKRLTQEYGKSDWGRQIISKRCLIGIDNDARAVTLARLALWLRLAEEPNPLPLPQLDECIVKGDSLSEATWSTLPDRIDLALGNPPFIATGSVQGKADLALHYETARGRFDYSYLFVELIAKKLSRSGVMGLVVPNRVFGNRDAGPLRDILTSVVRVNTVVDFGSSQVFEGTTSYTGVVVAAARSEKHNSELIRVIQCRNVPVLPGGFLAKAADKSVSEYRDEHGQAFDVPEITGVAPWVFLSPGARMARLRLQERCVRLDAVATIPQGIKTGANDIFVVACGTDPGGQLVYITNDLGEQHLIERDILRPVVYGGSLKRFANAIPDRFLIYPYRSDGPMPEAELRSDYPEAYKYLSGHRSFLASRASIAGAGIHWYELTRRRDVGWLTAPKLLMRDLAVETAFAIDPNGSVFLIGGTAVVPTDPRLLFALLGMLNSSLANWFLAPSTPGFKADYQKFEPQHIASLPVPERWLIDGPPSPIEELVRHIIESQSASENVPDELLSRLNLLIMEECGVDPREIG